jgi:hypothetical protein
MRAARALDDDTIEAIIAAASTASGVSGSASPPLERGGAEGPKAPDPDDETADMPSASNPAGTRASAAAGLHPPLLLFARQARAVGAEPVPAPSSELAALLEGRTKPVLGTSEAPHGLPVPSGLPGLRRRQRGRPPKLAMGTALAVAGVVSAGVVGILPAAATGAVRDAISVVSPVHLPGEHDGGSGPPTTDPPAPDARPNDDDRAQDRDSDHDRDGRSRDHDRDGRWDPHEDHDRRDRDRDPDDGRDFADDGWEGRHRPDPSDADENLDQPGVLGPDQDGSSGGEALAPDAPASPGDEADPGGDGRPGSEPPGGEGDTSPGGPTAP